jgi:putative ABC transport system ATP-binding protein
MPEALIHLRDVRFAWEPAVPVLDIPEFRLDAGETVFLRGASGSGKSTLLGLIAGVVPAQAGQVQVLGKDLSQLSGSARDRLRGERMGVIFQMFNLLPWLSVLENVTLACDFAPARRRRLGTRPRDEARRLLARLGLEDERWLSRPARLLSVGQQQRVAAARALIGGPDLVIADEPTSALDTGMRDRFIALLLEEATRTGAGVLFVSHDGALAGQFSRAVDLGDINRAMAVMS